MRDQNGHRHVPYAAVPGGMSMLEMALRGAEAEIEAQGWGQLNRLFWLARASCGCIEVREPTALNADLGRFYAPSVLQRITAGIARGDALPPTLAATWYGWLLSAEASSAVADPADQARCAEVRADMAAHRLHHRADAQQVRITFLGTRGGDELLLLRVRGQLSPRLSRSWWPADVACDDPVARAFQQLVAATVDRLGRAVT